MTSLAVLVAVADAQSKVIGNSRIVKIIGGEQARMARLAEFERGAVVLASHITFEDANGIFVDTGGKFHRCEVSFIVVNVLRAYVIGIADQADLFFGIF